MKPDDICGQFVEAGLKIKVWEEDKFVFIEGTREALIAIGELFIAQANYDIDDGFDIAPFCAGNAMFAPGSTTGIYISRVDESPESVKRRGQ